MVIEVDGLTHSWEITVKKDKRKTSDLEVLGYEILRFEDDDVMNHLDMVREGVEEWIKSKE